MEKALINELCKILGFKTHIAQMLFITSSSNSLGQLIMVHLFIFENYLSETVLLMLVRQILYKDSPVLGEAAMVLVIYLQFHILPLPWFPGPGCSNCDFLFSLVAFQ